MQATADLYVDNLLSEVAAYHTNHPFIAQQVFQPVQVAKSEGRFYVFGKKHLKPHDTTRAQGALSQEAGLSILGTQTFALNGHALKDYVTEEDRQDTSGTAVDPERDTTVALTEMLMLALEVELATKLTTTANYDTSYSETLTGTDQWSDYTNSKPITKIRDAMQQVHSGGVTGPYSLLLGKAVYDTLIDHPSITDRVKYTSAESVGPDVLARIFGARRVLVGEAVKNTAAENATDSLSYVWGKNAVIFADPVSPGIKQATFGRLFYDTVTEGGGPFWTRRWDEPARGTNVTAIEVNGRWSLEWIALDDLSDKDSVGGYLIAGAVA